MNLTQIAKESIAKSPIMEGKNKITTEEVVKDFAGGITLCDVDMIQGDNGMYPVFNFVENPGVFLCGGTLLTKIVENWIAQCGSLAEVRRNLNEENVKVKLSQGKTKNNRNIVNVEIL